MECPIQYGTLETGHENGAVQCRAAIRMPHIRGGNSLEWLRNNQSNGVVNTEVAEQDGYMVIAVGVGDVCHSIN